MRSIQRHKPNHVLLFSVLSTSIVSSAVLPALADPIILRGDQDTPLQGQASVNVQTPYAYEPPVTAPGMPPTAPLAAGAAASRYAGHAQVHGGPHYMTQQAQYDQHPYTAVQPHPRQTFFQRHPKVKSAAIGAGVGAVIGGGAGLITHHGVMKGAAIGAGAGAGVGLIRSSDTLRAHPIVKDMATGTVAGLGLGMATHRRLGGGVARETGLGAAVGLGIGVLRDKLK